MTTSWTEYYDPFDVQEEEEFLEIENQKNEKYVQTLIDDLIRQRRESDDGNDNSDDDESPSQSPRNVRKAISIPFSIEKYLLVELMEVVVEHFERIQKTGQKRCLWMVDLQFSHLSTGTLLELSKSLQKLTKLSTTTKTTDHHHFHHQNGCCRCLHRLALTTCGGGIWSNDTFKTIISSLVVTVPSSPTLSSYSYSSFIVSLDLSRNNLRNVNPSTFKEWIPKLSNLQELKLCSTGFDSTLVRALFEVLVTTTSTKLSTVDISNNFDSLETLLDCILDYIPKLNSTPIRTLILAKGASSSACIDYTNLQSKCYHGQPRISGFDKSSSSSNNNYHDDCSNDCIIKRLEKQMSKNQSLEVFGPLSLLPLDKESPSNIQQAYKQCQHSLENIEYYLGRNRLHHRFLITTTSENKINSNDDNSNNTDKDEKTSPSLSKTSVATPIENVLPEALISMPILASSSEYAVAMKKDHNYTCITDTGAAFSVSCTPAHRRVSLSLQYTLLRESADSWMTTM